MANLNKTVKDINRDIFQISGPPGKNMVLKAGQGEIKQGQVLAFENSTGLLVKYNKGGTAGTGVEVAFSIALAETDTSSVSIAVTGTKINQDLLVGMDSKVDFKAVGELFRAGILLEEVR